MASPIVTNVRSNFKGESRIECQRFQKIPDVLEPKLPLSSVDVWTYVVSELIIQAIVIVTELPFDASGDVWWGDSHTMLWEGKP